MNKEDDTIEFTIEEEIEMSFDDYYYTIYLPAHSKARTRRWHFVGNICTLAWISACVVLAGMVHAAFALGLALSPFVVYPFAWYSHLYIEKNKPLAWSNPFWAKVCDWRMCIDILREEIPWRDSE